MRLAPSIERLCQSQPTSGNQHPLADGGLELARRGCGPFLDILPSMDHGPRKGLADRDRPLRVAKRVQREEG
jgi:hypothetical protein